MQVIHLIKPYYLIATSSVRKNGLRGESLQTFFILLFCFLLALLIFHGTKYTLLEIKSFSHLAALPVGHILGLLLMVLFFTLIISNLVIALGRLFQSNDTDLLLSSPVSFSALFVSKVFLITSSASWMPAIFLLPVLIGFSEFNQFNAFQYLQLLLLLVPFFILPTLIAIFLGIFFIYLAPTQYIKLIFFTLVGIFVLAVVKFKGLIETQTVTLNTSESFLKLINILALPNSDWLPSNWIAHCYESILIGEVGNSLPEMFLLVGTILVSVSVAYFSFVLAYDEALSRSLGAKLQSAKSERLLYKLLHIIPAKGLARAFIIKEYTLLVRDIAQVVQVFLLLGLSSLYLYNLETLAYASSLSEKFSMNWSRFLTITTISVGCFFTIAVSNRLVFPTFSLEGLMFSQILSSPIKLEKLMKTKFLIWFLPISILSSFFFYFGAWAIHFDFWSALVLALFGFLCAYSSVGIAIGLGAKFSRFDWEYSTQLAASFGGVFFMLSSVSVFFISLLPLMSLLKVLELLEGGSPFSSATEVGFLLCTLVILTWLPHIVSTRLAQAAGLRELKSQLK